MSVLAINTGSTSLKFGLFEGVDCQPVGAGEIDWADGNRQQARFLLRPALGPARSWRLAVPDDAAAATEAIRVVAQALLDRVLVGNPISAVGHRVVHGGAAFQKSMRIGAEVKAAINGLCGLAPLHNPPALRAIEAAEAALPGVPQVAVFDTAFFARLPRKSQVFPLPWSWYEEKGIRRFGFHGISHGYCAGRAAELLGRELSSLRIISCHLGGGCSLAAVHGGVALATTMGFSPLGGLFMGTRCGSIDPGILLHLQREGGLSLAELDRGLTRDSGLLGVSGISSDLAGIEAAAAQGNERAQLAFDMFADRVRAAIGEMAASIGGVDVLVFTDRIGENSPALRAAACQGLEFMGIALDGKQNAIAVADVDIAAEKSPARVLVLRTREEWMVAREALAVVGGA